MHFDRKESENANELKSTFARRLAGNFILPIDRCAGSFSLCFIAQRLGSIIGAVGFDSVDLASACSGPQCNWFLLDQAPSDMGRAFEMFAFQMPILLFIVMIW